MTQSISKYFFVLLIIASTKNVFSQMDKPIISDSLVSYEFMCFDSLNIDIPSGIFKIQKDSYEEGFILLILYTDASYISILCGGNASLNIKTVGKENLFNRKEIIDGRQIIYENVPIGRRKIFDLAFDRLVESGLNRGN